MDNIDFTPDQKAKLTQLINDGCNVLREVADLHGGMKDTTKAVAEELNIKASTLNKAIRIAYKSDFIKRVQSTHSWKEFWPRLVEYKLPTQES